MTIPSIHLFLQSFNILSNDEIDSFVELLEDKTLLKSEFFIQEGQTCNHVAFIRSGGLRSFYTNNNGDEITYCITFPNSLMTAYSSYLTAQPTQENIQAIAKTELQIVSKEQLEKLIQPNSNWIYFLKTIAELEKRIFQLQKNDATQRYAELLRHQPELIQKIPLQYLASYLGITQRHLSRIRKEMDF
jgi:CRP-like cAMP-binding protein